MEEKKRKILVVDDEPEITTYVKKYLSAQYYDVHGANSSEEALRLLEKEPFDLVMLDIIMHGLHGDALARIIREKYPNTKVFIITAHPEAGYRINSDAVFIKPVCIEDIHAKIVTTFI